MGRPEDMDLMGEEAVECQNSKERRLMFIHRWSFEHWLLLRFRRAATPPNVSKGGRVLFTNIWRQIVAIYCCEERVLVMVLLKEGLKKQMAVCHMEGWS